MEFLHEYGIFFAKVITIIGAIMVVTGFFALFAVKEKEIKHRLTIENVNKKFKQFADIISNEVLNKKELKEYRKTQKKLERERESGDERKRIFVLDFFGDIRASATKTLCNEVTAILMTATEKDEVLVRLESGGGMVHGYGLAASILQRIKDANIPLTIAVDKIAASGGYMMACVADRILAAPFAIVGSIGVIIGMPNFNRLMKRHNIEYEQIMAGEYKRTLTVFGENTKKDREKVQEDVEKVHDMFKKFVLEYRPALDLKTVATGEHWHGLEAKKLHLVDQIQTSEDYLLRASKHYDIYEVKFAGKKQIMEKLSSGVHTVVRTIIDSMRKEDTQI